MFYDHLNTGQAVSLTCKEFGVAGRNAAFTGSSRRIIHGGIWSWLGAFEIRGRASDWRGLSWMVLEVFISSVHTQGLMALASQSIQSGILYITSGSFMSANPRRSFTILGLFILPSPARTFPSVCYHNGEPVPICVQPHYCRHSVAIVSLHTLKTFSMV